MLTPKRFIPALVLLLAGCAASAQTRPAYVDVNALLPHHPLYGTLAQYDRQIAALEATLNTRFANADAQIDNASRAVNRDAAQTASAYSSAIARTNRRTVALNLNAPTQSQGDIEQSIQQTYEEQRAELQDTAQRDMQQYRSALSQQQRAAFDAFVASVNDRSAQAVARRAQELQERESNLLLELARKNAGRRLMLRAKLQTLYLRPEQRRSLLAQLNALQAQEDRALATARREDTATLRAYTAQVKARAQSDVAQMQQELASRGSGNLAARERVLASQNAAAPSLNLDSGGTVANGSARRGSAADMQAAYHQLTTASLPPDASFGAAANDITTRWHDLRAANDADTVHTRSQIAWLLHDREAVRKRMISQILYEADKVAKERGYSGAIAGHAPQPQTDITAAVASDLTSLSP